jgi:hypothetical protein
MTILKETEQIHDVLGPVYFDNGTGIPKIRLEDYEPFWVGRPKGWSAYGVEILLSGDISGPAPDSLDRAVQVFRSFDNIEKEGRDLIRPKIVNTPSTDFDVTHYEADLLWIDCRQINITVGFRWEGYAYISWQATLNEINSITDLQEIIS